MFRIIVRILTGIHGSVIAFRRTEYGSHEFLGGLLRDVLEVLDEGVTTVETAIPGDAFDGVSTDLVVAKSLFDLFHPISVDELVEPETIFFVDHRRKHMAADTSLFCELLQTVIHTQVRLMADHVLLNHFLEANKSILAGLTQ